MISETGMQQQYCLRWNNHKTNLLTVFGELFRNEDFTDVTLACEGGSFIKCHKMVLAASSSYFQCLFSELPCRHPVVVLKDVRYSEIQAILEYMYKGEVSITVEEVEPLLKVAEALKVKGLMGENNFREEYNISTCSSFGMPPHTQSGSVGSALSSAHRRSCSPNDLRTNVVNAPQPENNNNNSSSSNNNVENACLSPANKSNMENSSSLPHSTGLPFHKASYMYGKPSSDRPSNRMSLPIWPMAALPLPTPPTPHTAAAAMFHSCYEAVIAASNSSSSSNNNNNKADVPPHQRRKKLTNFNMNRDTPILRTVLGQGQADSSQPMSLVCHTDGQDQVPQSNGPTTLQDGSSYIVKSGKIESASEDVHSPYMDTSFLDEDLSQDRSHKVMHSSSSSPQSYYSEPKGGVSSAIATLGPHKPEWKRYKQYTRNDIMSAIDAVKNGMSALQAARRFGVPSRTLYDKVKKLGITTSRPFRRTNGSNGTAFPYGISGTAGPMMFGLSGDDDQTQAALLDHSFLQHALESGAKMKFENSDRDVLSETTSTTSPHPLFLQRALEEERVKSEIMMDRDAISPNAGDNSGTSTTSPPPNDRSPSPNLANYTQHHDRSLTPSPTIAPPDDEYEDQVEDLSMSRRPEQQQARVIMPPMNQATATMLATCSDSTRD